MLRGASGRTTNGQSSEPDLLDTIFEEFDPDAPTWMPGPRRPEDYYKRAQQIVEYRRKREFTTGAYVTEVESAAAFDRAVPHDLFKMYREVWGTLTSPRPGQDKVRMRIDRILVPKAKLLDLGWKFGIIGCELKRSQEKIGPAIAQAMDYTRTTWLLDPDRLRYRVCTEFVFIWPMAKQSGAIASICAQNRIGSAFGDERYVKFGLKCGETGILEVRDDYPPRVGKVLPGARTGCR